MTLVLSAFISIAAFTGTSILFGAFLAGTFITYLPSRHPEGPFVVMSREEGESHPEKSPTFVHTFERYLLGPQEYLMEPLFFSSIGFAIPFSTVDGEADLERCGLYPLDGFCKGKSPVQNVVCFNKLMLTRL